MYFFPVLSPLGSRLKMNDKDFGNKYDRQLRLWNSNGQNHLSNSKICLINANTLASELLKNLVLSGVGKIIIIDSNIINEKDLASNFFFDESDLGSIKSEKISLSLNKLNPDIIITHEDSSLETLISDINYWKSFNCIIDCSDFNPLINKLQILLWDLNIPLIKTSCIGFYSYLKIQLKEQTIIETHENNNNLEDLRIDFPWIELQNYIDSIDLAECNDLEFSSIPFSIILTKLFQAFTAEHDDMKPNVLNIRKMLKTLSRSHDELNLIEANKRAMLVIKDSKQLPLNLKNIFNNNEILNNINFKTPIFWILIKSLKLFYEKFSILPLSGVLPDMESNTEKYINLKKIYKLKFENDKSIIKSNVLKTLQELGRSPDEISDHILTSFVKNCRFLKVHSNSNLNLNLNDGENYENYNNTSNSNLNIYISFLIIQNFFKKFNRNPSTEDRAELRTIAISTLCNYNEIKNFPDGLDKILDEFCRANSCELHNICALTGGIAAQEVIKLLTNQYVTLDNCLAFDGINCRAVSWKI